MARKREISYINKDFDGFKEELKSYLQKYFPTIPSYDWIMDPLIIKSKRSSIEYNLSINDKINTMIHRISNCEDILFYLMINEKIKLSLKHWCSIIMMDYHDGPS